MIGYGRGEEVVSPEAQVVYCSERKRGIYIIH